MTETAARDQLRHEIEQSPDLVNKLILLVYQHLQNGRLYDALVRLRETVDASCGQEVLAFEIGKSPAELRRKYDEDGGMTLHQLHRIAQELKHWAECGGHQAQSN
ncbi:MAG: hypothetical protein ACE361_00890 [Aureliella sp.]